MVRYKQALKAKGDLMKDVRFYQDFGTKKAKRAYWDSGKLEIAPNCVALFTDGKGEAIVALHDHHNSHVTTSSVSTEYLRKHCVRCSEEMARLIHPNLFKRLDVDQAPKKKTTKTTKTTRHQSKKVHGNDSPAKSTITGYAPGLYRYGEPY